MSNVNHPSHYNKGKFEVIDVIEDWKLGFHLGNAVKYIARAEHKDNNVEDLRKAAWYINREIALLEGAVEKPRRKVGWFDKNGDYDVHESLKTDSFRILGLSHAIRKAIEDGESCVIIAPENGGTAYKRSREHSFGEIWLEE